MNTTEFEYALKIKGQISSIDNLPTSNISHGDIYLDTSTGNMLMAQIEWVEVRWSDPVVDTPEIKITSL